MAALPPPVSLGAALTTASTHSAAYAGTLNPLGKKAQASMAQIDKVAQDFESVFATQMLEPMFNSQDTQWFGGGESEDVFRMLMVQQFGTLLAKSGHIGIADMVKKELLSLQEVQQTPQTVPTVKG